MSSISNWISVGDEAVGEGAALVEAAVGDVTLPALLDRAEHRRPGVVAGEGELGAGPGQAQEERGVAGVEAADTVADEGSHGGLIHSVCPYT